MMSPEWSEDRFEAKDSFYGIECCSSNKDKCINFVKGSLLHAVANGYSNEIPDNITIEFVVKNEN